MGQVVGFLLTVVVSLAISWFFWWRQRRPRLEVSYTLTELGALVPIDTPERPVPPLLTAANPATPVLLLLSMANVGRDDLVAEGLSSTRVLCDGGRTGIFPADDDCADAH